MLDHLIKSATIVDGTGSAPYVADIGVRDGRIVTVGTIDELAAHVVDGDGLVATPGFVDLHTHYDAQLLWDPFATPSNIHGVTTVIGGNCGFTLAPLQARDADYTARMMARVEGMALPALRAGVDWSWTSFGEYLDRLDGRLAVNAGFLVGHCALRRYVLGEASVGELASSDQVDAMVTLLHESIAAGGLGLSTTLSRTHSDGDGKPVPSRWAGRDELLALCTAVGEHDGTSLEGIVDGCLDGFTEPEVELLAAMSAAAGRPLNWNVLTVDSRDRAGVMRQLNASSEARELGGELVALTMPVLVPMNMSLLTFCALHLIPGWGDVLSLPVPERIDRLRDPAVRRMMVAQANSEAAGVHRRHANFAGYVIGDTFSAQNEGLSGRVVSDVAAERGDADPFDTLVDIAIADDLRTVWWPTPTDDDDDSWALRREVWEDPRALLGGSDAGAHLDRMCGAPYPTRFLADVLRGRQLVSLERAVQLLTDAPARLVGLRERGRLAEGWHADIVLFDPAEIGAGQATFVSDLPAGSKRLVASSSGVLHVLVNGIETVVNGAATGQTPGTLLRSSRDTTSVSGVAPSR